MFDSTERIIKDLVEKKDSIIPIIGNDMIVYKPTETSKEILLQEHILEHFSEGKHIDPRKLNAMKKQSYYGMSVFSKEDSYFIDDYCRYIKQGLKERKIRLKEKLLDFLKEFNFPIIITTICFDIIEQELRDMGIKYSSARYVPKNPRIVTKDNSLVNKDLPNRCIYHIFGIAEDAQDWVFDEEQLLFFLKSLNDINCGAIGLANHIKNHRLRLLVLGCNLPDWLFRFLWCPIQEKSNGKTKQGYWLNKEMPNASFEDFLEEIRYTPAEEIEDILSKATKQLVYEREATINNIQNTNNRIEHYDIFLSYASEDRSIVDRIYDILHNQHHLSVWFDDRGEGEINIGDPYWENIKEGIEKSTHFMPIITEHYLEKSIGTSNLNKETEMAYDFYIQNKDNLKRNYSIPIIIKGECFRRQSINSTLIEDLGKLDVIHKEFFTGIKSVEYNSIDEKTFNSINWENIL